jgi:hypothetical protein
MEDRSPWMTLENEFKARESMGLQARIIKMSLPEQTTAQRYQSSKLEFVP